MAQLSNRYASALFDLSLEQNILDENLEHARFLRDTLAEEQCQLVINHPRITAKEKKSFFNEAFLGHINNDLLGFMHLAVDKNREEYIVSVLTEFISMGDRHNRKATAYVVSAVALSDKQVSDLAELLSRKLDKQVEINLKVNQGLIGGLYVQVDGFYIDRTIRTRLQDIKDSLINGKAV